MADLFAAGGKPLLLSLVTTEGFNLHIKFQSSFALQVFVVKQSTFIVQFIMMSMQFINDVNTDGFFTDMADIAASNSTA